MDQATIKKLRNALIIIGVVVVIFLVIIVSKAASKPHTAASGATGSSQNTTGSSPAPAYIADDLANVSMSTLDKIGTGTADSKPLPISASALTENAKPEILFEGAEFCPYCATERWAMGVALSKFGTFSDLGVTHSSSSDVYPDTQTISFYKSTYTSPYITFTPIEVYTNIASGDGGYTTLQIPTASEQNTVTTYDSSTYLPAGSAESIPFIDFGNKYLIAGATYDPEVLQGKSESQIAGSLGTDNNSIASGADGAASTMIAAICKLTNNQPANVCDTTMQKIENSL